MPRARVFCVNFEGELQSLNNTFRKSYANINALLDEIFPPVSDMNKARTTSDQFVDGEPTPGSPSPLPLRSPTRCCLVHLHSSSPPASEFLEDTAASARQR